ncbi:MAG: prephenate dehydrogenase [Actinobacteria bacterium]|nr:prephenate dehydrogenase [Actinomycetota bacterium]MCG2819912.1 prephenate dehydrogenase [Actinomycetes bacterium]MBU4218999.1 prephenate dehydrogenase [Actinomycetota bacterium]MBU4359187.1 prephenate dehydrogenase [Actinomycetota bacterium]MBU4391502.1 prephenate dehydrogenase [Actinomycetota bacterium]
MANFKKVAIIGTGLMGGSLSMALKAHPGVGHVAVYDISPDARLKARELEISDEVTGSPGEAVRGCDLLFLATPISAMVKVVHEVSGDLPAGAIISDLGSAKLETAAALGDATPPGMHYVGGHPMTGSEQSGVEFASADLFRNCYYILTPTVDTDSEAFRRLHGLITDMGARVISMDPETHDKAMATVSHTPHMLSLLLMDMAGKQYKEMKSLFTVAAGGFRDMTRIAASSPDVWVDICMENRKFIVQRLLEYGFGITELIDMLENRDRVKLEELFRRARRARAELSVKAGREIDELFEVSLPVTDRPGVISEVSTAVGSLGINIEDVEIVHPLEGETGILTLRILGREQAGEARDRLEFLGYKAAVREG